MFCIDGCDWLTVLLGRNADSRKSNYRLYSKRTNFTIADLFAFRWIPIQNEKLEIPNLKFEIPVPIKPKIGG